MTSLSRKPQSPGPIARAAAREDAAMPRFASFIAMTLAGMVGGLLVLAGNTLVPQVTRAPGVIVPVGNYRQIESRDGGIVSRVFVNDGDRVEAGSVLLQLTNPDLMREAQSLSQQRANLERKWENANALLLGVEAPAQEALDHLHQMTARGLDQGAARFTVFIQAQSIKSEAIAQQRKTLEILEMAHRFAIDRADRQSAFVATTRDLADRGLTTKNELQAAEFQADSLRAQASDAAVRIAQSSEALVRARADQEAEALSLRETVLAELAEIDAELASLRAASQIADDRLSDLEIVAPAAGRVQSVSFPSAGEVIEPGETVFDLLPIRQSLIVEARIPNVEIGHIEVGHDVAVSFDSYDVRRYGKAEGTLASFSPVPLTDELTGQQYFRAAIELSDTSIGRGGFERPVQAGLTVVAEMVTGEKTLLAYFLKPIEHTLQRAFSER